MRVIIMCLLSVIKKKRRVSELIEKEGANVSKAYVINQSNAFDVKVLPIKRFLQQLNDVMPNRTLRRKPFCPCQNLAFIQRSLLDRKTKC